MRKLQVLCLQNRIYEIYQTSKPQLLFQYSSFSDMNSVTVTDCDFIGRVSTSPPEMRGWPGCLASLALQVCFTANPS